jgi:hypothetical protein
MSDGAEHDRTVANDPAVLRFSQPDRLTHQSCGDVDELAVEFDLSVVTNPAHLPITIFRRAQDAVEASR